MFLVFFAGTKIVNLLLILRCEYCKPLNFDIFLGGSTQATVQPERVSVSIIDPLGHVALATGQATQKPRTRPKS
jgi:hypothetical protein